MIVWLVNPFDPLPGEQEAGRRYASLARYLVAANHHVVWWSSDYCHRFKRRINNVSVAHAEREAGMDIRLLKTLTYRSNVSLRRILSHAMLAANFLVQARRADPPDVIFVSLPPLELATAAVHIGDKLSIPVIIDIQDQWPDTFLRLMPSMLRPMSRVVLFPYYALEHKAYVDATAIVAVARGYLEHGFAVGGGKRYHGVFPIGVNIQMLTGLYERIKDDNRWPKTPGEVRFIYAGTLSLSYDLQTMLQAMLRAKKGFGSRVSLFFCGIGEQYDLIRVEAECLLCGNVTFLPFLDQIECNELMATCDVGVCAATDTAMIYLPGKLSSYLGAGLAVLNGIKGECAENIYTSKCGLNYTAGDVESCFAAICTLVNDDEGRMSMRKAARKTAKERFDIDKISLSLARFVEDVAFGGS